MATYDLTQSIPSEFKTGDILNCPYSGSAKSITLPKGTYKLECWGAQGGNYNNFYGGAGGYSIGTLTLQNDTILYLYAGGQPASLTGSGTSAKGFNGGGSGTYHSYSSATTYCQGGGGGSDIRIGTDSLYARVIVAGGGGGSASVNALTTKVGGGIAGTSATGSFHGTQTAAGTNGSFGQGANGTVNGSNYNYAAAGGGGGWYGGGASSSYSDSDSSLRNQNGGGSGYVYTSSTASNYPSGCLLNSSYYLTNADTTAGNLSFPSPTGTTETGHTGNGYVKITVIKSGNGNTLVKVPMTSTLPSGYTQLEYIKSSGTQYIDTGFKPTSNTRVVMDVKPLEVPSILAFFGTRDSSTPTASLSYNAWATSTTYIRSDYFGSSILSNETNVLTRGTIDKNKNVLTGYGQTITNTASTEEECSYSLFLLACNDMGTAKYYLKSILYSCKIYDNGTLVRNFIPAKNSSNTVGLYDTVNSKFYENAMTSAFEAGPETTPWKNYKNMFVKTPMTLPSGYTQLEYIQSSGTQYIDTGVIINQDTRIVLDFQVNENQTSEGHLASVIDSAGSEFYVLSIRPVSNVMTFATRYHNSALTNFPNTITPYTRHIIDKNKNITTIDGKNTITLTTGTFTCGQKTLPLFCRSAATSTISYNAYISMKLYSCKIYDNGTLIRNFIPAKNSSGTLGLYDTVNSKFYTNAGTGTFVAGSNASPWKQAKGLWIKDNYQSPLPSGYTELEYLQSSGTQYINTNMFYVYVKATYEIMSVGSTHIAIFGSRTSSSSSDQFAFGYAAHQSPKLWRFDYESEHQPLDSSLVGTELSWSGKHTFTGDIPTGSLDIDNNQINLGFATSIDVSSSLPLYLFALNTNGTAGEIGNTRIYSFKLYNSLSNYNFDNPVLNLIPAKNSSGTFGMYDTVGGKFYTNAGTGEFIAGPQINPWKQVF